MNYAITKVTTRCATCNCAGICTQTPRGWALIEADANDKLAGNVIDVDFEPGWHKHYQQVAPEVNGSPLAFWSIVACVGLVGWSIAGLVATLLLWAAGSDTYHTMAELTAGLSVATMAAILLLSILNSGEE